MTPNALALVLLLTFLAVQIVQWILPPPDAKRLPLLTLVLLVVFFVWVIGVPLLVVRG